MATLKLAHVLVSLLFITAVFSSDLAPSPSGPGRLLLTIAWCPDFTSGKGAIVEIDLTTGKWMTPLVFDWPKTIKEQGCVGEFDTPAFSVNPQSDLLLLDFVNAFGLMVELDLKSGKSTQFHPSDPFFVGFLTVFQTDLQEVKGLAGTVTENGYCKDACIGVGTLQFPRGGETGKFNWIHTLPYKAVMDDVHYFDSKSNTVWSQLSYPLTPEAKCSKVESDNCLVAINLQDGSFKSVFTNYTIYDTVPGSLDSNGNIFAFIEGFDNVCKNTEAGDFLFAQVNLLTGIAKPVVCMQKGVVDQEGEWISSFSLDRTLWATASGDADAGQSQLLVVDTKTGKPKFDNLLKGLPESLKAWENFIWVWSVNFVE